MSSIEQRRINKPSLLRAKRCLPALLSALALLISTGAASARSFRVNQIPNGAVNGCANCHINPGGGGPRNPFGTTIETSFLSTPGATGNVLWGPALAGLDSDGDGRSNGLELQDSNGAWSIGQANPGNPAFVRLPGTVDPAPVPALPLPWTLVLAAGFAIAGVTLVRRRALGG